MFPSLSSKSPHPDFSLPHASLVRRTTTWASKHGKFLYSLFYSPLCSWHRGSCIGEKPEEEQRPFLPFPLALLHITKEQKEGSDEENKLRSLNLLKFKSRCDDSGAEL